MRRLFYCGEWIESHGLHIHMLAAPDFLGFASVLEMAKVYPKLVKRGMAIHSLGVELMALLGKRSVHPVGACVGGFYYAPKISDVKNLCKKFEASLPLAQELLDWALALDLPKHSQDFNSVSLKHPNEYPMNEGQIVSSAGLDIDISQFEQYFKESHVEHSTALHCALEGRSYLVGPLARVNLNFEILPTKIKNIIKKSQISFPSKNMFHSIIARSIEIYYSMLEAIRIMKGYYLPTTPFVKSSVKAGIGYGATEAPRGLLWHRFEFSDDGLVTSSRIIPPTSQNQFQIEEDLKHTLEEYGLNHSDAELRLKSEMVIRNYDPCISCSTHFLTLKVDRQ
jgi:coenzyme F420-reducing hydrogenase alpha subunit